MLVKRTNILFEEDLWSQLTLLAKRENISIGKIVRDAVRKVHFSDEENLKARKAFENVLKIRKHFKHIDYKELINAGRKY